MSSKALIRKPSKIRPVLISSVVFPPALITQRTYREAHANQIAAEMDFNKLGFPIVNHKGSQNRVLDGQHRIKALLIYDPSLADTNLDCEVYEDLTEQEEAEIFLGRDRRKAIPPFDKFHVSCTAGHKRENDIRRAVEANGQKIARDKDEGISAVGSLGKVYDRAGDVVLGQVIRAINLGFGGDPLAFDRSVIEGLGLVFHRFNGRTNEKAVAHRLSELRKGAHELLLKAESLRQKTGNQKTHCVAAVVVDIYNKGMGPRDSQRLPSWWKETV